MSFGQPPICDSECINCQKEPGARPGRGEKPPVPPKPAHLKAQKQATAGGSDYSQGPGEPTKAKKVPPPVAPKPNRPQPGNSLLPPPSPRPGGQRQPEAEYPDVFRAPNTPHTIYGEEEQYEDYMRSRPPSQGDGEMGYVDAATMPRGRRVPARRQKQVYSIDPITRRRVFRPADSDGPSPHTPPGEDEDYTEYMRSRPLSQGFGEMNVREPRTVPPINRNRLYGVIDSSESSPWTTLNNKYNLTSDEFDQVMKSTEKAFVLFFDPKSGSTCAIDEFLKAAVKSHPYNYSFGSVDCTKEQQLCAREEVTKLPIFKLYSNGFDLSTIRDVDNFCANQIEMLMTKTPVLTQPRKNMAPGLERR